MIFIERDMWCDVCGERGHFGDHNVKSTAAMIRKRAKAAGWKQRTLKEPTPTGLPVGRMGDVCPDCISARRAERSLVAPIVAAKGGAA